MTGYEYEKKCAKLLIAKGFTDIQVTPGSGDQGIDVLAKKGSKKYGIQCKYYEGSVGNKAVQEAFAGASYYDCAVAMVITNSKLTDPAKKLAQKLGVQVWEGIDAVSLRRNDAEYQKKEAELQKKEQERKEREKRARQAREEAKKQEKLLAFQQWQTAYQAVIEEREKTICAEAEKLKQNDAERERGLSAEYEKRRDALSDHLSKLRTELEETRANLSAASWYQVSQKNQLKRRIKEIELEIDDAAGELKTAEDRYESDQKAVEQEHRGKLEQIRKKAEETISLPACPKVVTSVKERLMHDMIWEQAIAPTKNIVSLRVGNETVKQLILAELWETKLDTPFAILYNRLLQGVFKMEFVETLLTELEQEGKIKKSVSGFIKSYALIDHTIFSEVEREACNLLSKYTEKEIMAAMKKRKKKQDFSFPLYNEQKLQEKICIFLSMKHGAAYVRDVQNLSFQDISDSKTREAIRKLKASGKISEGLGGFRGTWVYVLTQKAETE